jgi:hypothetical protein
MSDDRALLIVDAAVSLHRSHPYAPAIDLLDPAFKGETS